MKFWELEVGQSFRLDDVEYDKTGEERAVMRYPPYEGVYVNNDDDVEIGGFFEE